MNGASRVLVVDDDAQVRDAYRSFLLSNADFELVGEATNGQEGVQEFARLQPDIVLMDMQMPVMTGIEATRAICSRWPGACIVALTTFGSSEYIVAALKAGASGYLLKDATAKALPASMHQALAGEMPLSSAVRRALVASVVSDGPSETPTTDDLELTAREKELLGWLGQGLSNHQIAQRMFVSEGTVKQYLAHAGNKLGVKSRTQILVRAIQLNLVDPHAMDLM